MVIGLRVLNKNGGRIDSSSSYDAGTMLEFLGSSGGDDSSVIQATNWSKIACATREDRLLRNLNNLYTQQSNSAVISLL